MTEHHLPATQFDLRTLTTPEVVVERVYSAADLAQEGDAATADYRIKGDVRFVGLLRKGDQRYQLQGTARAILELNCGRCLEAFELPVVADVDLTYVPQPSPSAAAAPSTEVELQDEDLSTAYYQDQVLDLGEMLREQFNLALPMRPLCQDACKGLCPHCGTNLNHGTCACDAKWEDPRLAVLRSLLPNKEHSA